MAGATVLPSGLTWEELLPLLDRDEYKNAELRDGQVADLDAAGALTGPLLPGLAIRVGELVAR